VSVFRSWRGLLQLCLLARNKPNSTRRLALQIAQGRDPGKKLCSIHLETRKGENNLQDFQKNKLVPMRLKEESEPGVFELQYSMTKEKSLLNKSRGSAVTHPAWQAASVRCFGLLPMRQRRLPMR
jgi:hypothetical protein